MLDFVESKIPALINHPTSSAITSITNILESDSKFIIDRQLMDFATLDEKHLLNIDFNKLKIDSNKGLFLDTMIVKEYVALRFTKSRMDDQTTLHDFASKIDNDSVRKILHYMYKKLQAKSLFTTPDKIIAEVLIDLNMLQTKQLLSRSENRNETAKQHSNYTPVDADKIIERLKGDKNLKSQYLREAASLKKGEIKNDLRLAASEIRQAKELNQKQHIIIEKLVTLVKKLTNKLNSEQNTIINVVNLENKYAVNNVKSKENNTSKNNGHSL